MNIIYFFIKSENPFSFQCFKAKSFETTDSIQTKITNRTIQTYITGLINHSPAKMMSYNPNNSRGNTNTIIKVEYLINYENAAPLLDVLKGLFPTLENADAFPCDGTLSLDQSEPVMNIKMMSDTQISHLFEQGDIAFDPVPQDTPLFPKYRLTSDQIKQSMLGECAFSSIIIGFCLDRPYTIYNCMRDNNDGFILCRFYSQNQDPIPCFYLLEKSTLRSVSSGQILTQHFLWAHILLKAYAMHMACQIQSMLPTPSTTTPSSATSKLALQTFLNSINYIDLSHALTGGQKVDFFGAQTKAYDNLTFYIQANPSLTLEMSCLRAFSRFKQYSCPAYLSATRAHFGGSGFKDINGKRIYASHSYCILKVRGDSVTVLNPWQTIVSSPMPQTFADVSHIRHSLNVEDLRKLSSGHAASSASTAPTTLLSSSVPPQQPYLEEALYDADTENYNGAITLHASEFLQAFNCIRVCKKDSLRMAVKNEIVKIIQAYIQFIGYQDGLVAILQRIFLNYLPETESQFASRLKIIAKELKEICKSLPRFEWDRREFTWSKQPINKLKEILESLLQPDPLQPQITTNFNQPYDRNFLPVYNDMNCLYAPYRDLFQIIHSTSYNPLISTEFPSILQKFIHILDCVKPHLNIRMYGETLLTYAIKRTFRYRTDIICYFIHELLLRNISILMPNIRDESSIMLVFTQITHVIMDPNCSLECQILLRIANQIVNKLRIDGTTEELNEIKKAKNYLSGLPPDIQTLIETSYEKILDSDRIDFTEKSFEALNLEMSHLLRHRNFLEDEFKSRMKLFEEENISTQKFRTFPCKEFAKSCNTPKLRHALHQISNIIRCENFEKANIYLKNLRMLKTNPFLTKDAVSIILNETDDFIESMIQDSYIKREHLGIILQKSWQEIKNCIMEIYWKAFPY